MAAVGKERCAGTSSLRPPGHYLQGRRSVVSGRVTRLFLWELLARVNPWTRPSSPSPCNPPRPLPQAANTTSTVSSFISAPGPDDTVKLLAFADVGQYNEDGTKGFGYWYDTYGLFDEFYAIGTLQYTVSAAVARPGLVMRGEAGRQVPQGSRIDPGPWV